MMVCSVWVQVQLPMDQFGGVVVNPAPLSNNYMPAIGGWASVFLESAPDIWYTQLIQRCRDLLRRRFGPRHKMQVTLINNRRILAAVILMPDVPSCERALANHGRFLIIDELHEMSLMPRITEAAYLAVMAANRPYDVKASIFGSGSAVKPDEYGQKYIASKELFHAVSKRFGKVHGVFRVHPHAKVALVRFDNPVDALAKLLPSQVIRLKGGCTVKLEPWRSNRMALQPASPASSSLTSSSTFIQMPNNNVDMMNINNTMSNSYLSGSHQSGGAPPLMSFVSFPSSSNKLVAPDTFLPPRPPSAPSLSAQLQALYGQGQGHLHNTTKNAKYSKYNKGTKNTRRTGDTWRSPRQTVGTTMLHASQATTSTPMMTM
jgi:hypothetical protein